MRLPFTSGQFFDAFRRYNEAVWPTQWLLLLFALLAIMLAIRGGKKGRAVCGILGFLWLWMAIAYHLAVFRTINPAAIGFAVLFAIEGILLLIGAGRTDLGFRFQLSYSGIAGTLLIAYSLLLYPVIAYALGHRYPAAPTFGLPCPTTIFTLGILMWGTSRALRYLAIIPLIWVLIGSQAVFALGIWEDLGLVVAGTLFLATAWHRIARFARSNGSLLASRAPII
jgi:hypothetical protein